MNSPGMTARPDLSTRERRRSVRASYANAALWGVGSGLANTTLVTYLAREYRATGLAISWLLAAPSMVGLLRLLTPYWLDRVRSRRRFCLGMFLASSLALLALPIASRPGWLAASTHSIVALGVSWSSYQVLEYFGAVALWSWLGDLVPLQIRGRFLGRREACMTAGVVVGTVCAALGTWQWHLRCLRLNAPQLEWQAYAACGMAGAVMFALAVIPLAMMAEVSPRLGRAPTDARLVLRDRWQPLVDRRYRRFMAFGLWFSISNGIMQTAQQVFLMSGVKLSLAEKKSLDGGSRGIQALLLPGIGALVDRRGNVPVLAVSQGIISLASVFFLYATPDAKWWVLGAYACWLAYGGENVTLPNLMLGLSRPGQAAAYTAAWFAWTQLAYSLSVLSGGALYDWIVAHFQPVFFAGRSVDHFFVIFLAGWLLKSLGVALALRIPEPSDEESSSC